jgi:threonine/homoserine/homoserine lactone efflux protein
MEGVHAILVAALTGFISGFLLSIPVGPINLTIMNEGARRGFVWASMIGLGATVMEVIYCFVAFTGFSSFFEQRYIKAGMELFTFVFLLFLGVKFLMAKSVQGPMPLGPTAERLETQFEEKVEAKLHPHSAFMTGLVRVMGNLGVLVCWVFLGAYFLSHGWVTPDWAGRLSCIAGVALGTGVWFIGLSWLVSLRHGKFSERALLRMEHISGICLLVLASIHGGRIISQLAHHKL